MLAEAVMERLPGVSVEVAVRDTVDFDVRVEVAVVERDAVCDDVSVLVRDDVGVTPAACVKSATSVITNSVRGVVLGKEVAAVPLRGNDVTGKGPVHAALCTAGAML